MVPEIEERAISAGKELQSSIVAPANGVFGDWVSALSYSLADAFNGEICRGDLDEMKDGLEADEVPTACVGKVHPGGQWGFDGE